MARNGFSARGAGEIPDLTSSLIPTDCTDNHACFLAWLPDGSLGCAWFGGSREGRPDIAIRFSRWTEDGGWRDSVQVSDDATRSEQNPVIQAHADGSITLHYTSQSFSAQNTSIVLARDSADHGATWSPARTVFGEPGTFIRHGVVELGHGKWLFPLFTCEIGPGQEWRGDTDRSAVAIFADQGESWKRYEVPESTGLVHLCVVPGRRGGLLGFCRSRWADRVYRTESTDGRDWSAPVPLEVPNNNSSLQVTRAPDGSLLMVANPLGAVDRSDSRRAVWNIERLPLTLLHSTDEGVTWQAVVELENEVSVAGEDFVSLDPARRRPEMSYPSIVTDSAGRVHVAYTYGRRAIKHVVFPATVLHLDLDLDGADQTEPVEA